MGLQMQIYICQANYNLIICTWDLQVCVVQIESKKLKLHFVFKNLNSIFRIQKYQRQTHRRTDRVTS